MYRGVASRGQPCIWPIELFGTPRGCLLFIRVTGLW